MTFVVKKLKYFHFALRFTTNNSPFRIQHLLLKIRHFTFTVLQSLTINMRLCSCNRHTAISLQMLHQKFRESVSKDPVWSGRRQMVIHIAHSTGEQRIKLYKNQNWKQFNLMRERIDDYWHCSSNRWAKDEIIKK